MTCDSPLYPDPTVCASRKPHTKALSTSSFVFCGPSLRFHCLLQETEVYSKLYYSKCINPTVGERMKSVGPDVAVISIGKDVTEMLWDAEDAEVKALIATKVAESQEHSIEKENDQDNVYIPNQVCRLVLSNPPCCSDCNPVLSTSYLTILMMFCILFVS